MNYKTTAWTLAESGVQNELAFCIKDIFLGTLEHGNVLVETLYASWEGNMSHAIDGSPINICRARNESDLVVGNSAIVRVEKVNEYDDLKVGDVCIVHGAHHVDDLGHMVTALGYDGKGSRGFLCKKNIVPGKNLVKLPKEISTEDYPRWASFGVKYATAWSNLSLALKVYRTQVSEEYKPVLNIWAWGGGTSMGALHLANRLGHKTVMIVGNAEKKRQAEEVGIETIDRREISNLDFHALQEGKITRKDYTRAEGLFMRKVREITGRSGVDIFLDYIGQPTSNATNRALARYGVIATSGWKCGVNVNINRAGSCIKRQLCVHSHYCSKSEMLSAVAFAHDNNWLPQFYEEFEFQEARSLHDKYSAGQLNSYFPVIKIT